MKILVVGGAGYIGSHVCCDLVEAGHQVTVFDNLSKGFKSNIIEGEDFVEGDILSVKDLNNVFEKEKYDVVFHFAAFKAAGESMFVPEKYSVNNIIGSINLLNAMLKYDVKKIIFSSSSSVYGEPEYTPVDEKHKLNPESYYGYTKMCIEQNIKWYSKLKGIKFAFLRYFNAAGYDVKKRITTIEKDTTNLIPVSMETLFGKREFLPVYGNDYSTRDGSCIRDYIHTNDLSDGHIRALKYINDTNKNLIVNLGQNDGITVLEVVNTIKKIFNTKLNYKIMERRAGDPAVVIASNKLAYEKLGWKPQYSDIETILKTTYDVYKIEKN
jgi:UDP-glucose 4-epimerase